MIKKWKFQDADEWYTQVRNHEDCTIKLGNYYCRIGIFSWKDDGTACYQAAISTSTNPLNIYSNQIIRKSATLISRDEEDVKRWYKRITMEIEKEWDEYVAKTYLE